MNSRYLTGSVFYMRIPVFIAMLCTGISLLALEIPFYAGFDSANEAIYYPSRDTKEYGWDEKYRLIVGVDSLMQGDFRFDLRLLSRANFISQQVLIDRMDISYNLGKTRITGTSRPQGVAEDYFIQRLYIANSGFDRFQFAENRFNGLDFGYSPGKYSSYLGLGGNSHNQAMGYAGFQANMPDLAIGLRLDASARDAHWSTPQLMPSFFLRYKRGLVQISSDAAYNLILARGTRPAKEEYFACAELIFRLLERTTAVLGIQYQDRDHTPENSIRYSASVLQELGKFELIPSYEHRRIDGSASWQLGGLAQYKITPKNSLGIYTIYEHYAPDQTYYRFGLQSSLHLDF